MPITRLNHAVLFISDLGRSLVFYEGTLGFSRVMEMPGAAFLQAAGSANDHDLGLFEIGSDAAPSAAGRSTVGLYHLAWEVDTLTALEDMQTRLVAAGALVGASDHSTSKSLYARDPDGIELEIAWFVPAAGIDADVIAARSTIGRLDIPAEKARYGADTPGGVGTSN